MKKILMNKNFVTIFCSIIAIICILICLTGCSSWDSTLKDFESETKGGLDRTVKVYSQTGELLAEYEGKINIEYDESRVIFQIDRDKRIAIYSDKATVIVEEK